MWKQTLGLIAVLAMEAPAQVASAAADAVFPVLDDSTFDGHWQHVVPTAAELEWRRIPWLAQLADGVVAAQQSDRPILLWAMNGHPLACT